MKKIILILFVLLFGTTLASGQVRGVVRDKSGNALIGANVVWKGTNVGTTTDENGRFKLESHPDADAIVTSYIGFRNDTTQVEGTELVEVTLSDGLALDDVVVRASRPGTFKARKGAVNVEVISATELGRAACCNLGESFTTNPSVDVNYSDAATGARQIKLLGLSGTYVQMLTENVPAFRGAAAPFALGYVPGTWMQSIQVSKGCASVKNGFESITGQINIEYLKPQADESLDVNVFINNKLKMEANASGNIHINDKLSTGLLLHAEGSAIEHDENNDGFMDMPNVVQYDLMNRWMYMRPHYRMQAVVKLLKEDRNGGQINHTNDAPSTLNNLYKINIATERCEGFVKNAYIIDNVTNTSLALILSGSYNKMNSVYGGRFYNVNDGNFYAQGLYESDLAPWHNIAAGVSFNHDVFNEQYNLLHDVKSPDENVLGAYAQYTFNLNEMFVAMCGLRYDISSLGDNVFTPRANMKWAPNEHFNLRVSAGKGYRTPRPMLENHNLLASNRTIVIDENLDREEAWNFGANSSVNLDVCHKTLNVNVEYYYTNFLHQMVTDLDSNPHEVHFTNLNGKSYSHTFQVDATYPFFEGFSLTGAFRLNDVMTTINGTLREKPLTNKYKGLLTATYKTAMEIWQFDLTLQLNGGGRMPNPYTLPDGSKSWNERFENYCLLNAQIVKYFRWGSVYVGGENLTNFKQENPIISAENPWSDNFDATMIWGPVDGIMLYAGVKYKLAKL